MKKFFIIIIITIFLLLLINLNNFKNKNSYYKYKISELENKISSSSSKTKTACDIIVERNINTNLEIFEGEPKPVNFESNPDAKLFRTAITTQVATEGANFAGHYSIAAWGCGTNCQGYAIIDVINGEIVEYVPYNKFSAITGISGSINSNILVFNPRVRTDENGYQPNGYKEERTIEEILNDESVHEAGYGRFYYKLSKDYDGKPYLYPICVENFFDGATK